MDDSYAGHQAYLIIHKNNASCPIRVAVTDGIATHVVNRSGVVFIKSTWNVPYNSFTNLIEHVLGFPNLVSWVFHLDTGEGRLYDDPAGDATDFYPAEKRACGKVEDVSPTNRRPMEKLPEIGEQYPGDIKEQVYDAALSFKKVAIDKKKLTTYSKTSLVNNQEGFEGSGLIEVNEFDGTKNSNWYLVIVYTKDLSNDLGNFARVKIFPCMKFSEISHVVNTSKTIKCDMRGVATYCKSIPDDEPKVHEYVQSGAPV